MKKLIFIIPVSIVLMIILTGCWDRREVNDLAIAVALGIDKSEDKGYTVSAQILNPSEIASSSSGGGGSVYDTPVTTYTTSGDIIFEALRKLTQQVPRRIYLAHIRLIVIGEDIAEEGIYSVLDFLSRDPEMRTNFYIIVSKDSKAEDVLNLLTSIEKIPANKLFESLESSTEAWAATNKVKLNELMDDIVNEGVEPTLTAVKIIGGGGRTLTNVQTISPSSVLDFDGMAAFRKNKLVGWLTEDESKGLNYIKGNVQNTIVDFDFEGDQVGIELLHSTAEIIPHVQGNEPISIEVKLTGEANIAEVNTKLDLMTDNVFYELEEKTNEDIEGVITKAVNKAQKYYESDIFGFGEQINKKAPNVWEEIKDNWTEMFPDIKVKVSVDIKIRRVGTITNPIHNEIEE
ncbi:spore gernimation protein GerC [Ureibacillus massiliensis 4400831 = CIP 108448 = CCUG 49529]|uniref:Spore gernimation protein GerC n=1 Tax=Ureibacillus massiliensis 4400831 = CIP 108448 = CCUG 49529 TaxID=1211035 RepID=A0A0A3J855_9BACL|nr:Ger(x)C family spore germination protein [Ureibacillus massiliensis]KGR91318.1 spore gernimation protein GerC [Ureibacillus massiliensis 4400831 = CIP 108448 = CCUG 49529]